MIQPANDKSAEETTSEALLARIVTSLENDKAEDVVDAEYEEVKDDKDKK